MGPYLLTDYRKLIECLEDSLSRLECLKECHLQEFRYLPDFVFPLERNLKDSLEQALLVLKVQRVSLVELESQVEVLEPWVQKE